jgi:HSP20 family protein
MALIRQNPWSTLPTLQNRINRAFDDMFPEVREEMGTLGWRPMVDTYEKDDALVIQAELPGVKKEDISLDIDNRVLTIRGERRYEDDVNQKDYHRQERFYGKFQRSFTLPDNVDPNRVDANYSDGVLKVTLPKTEESQTKKIEIK